VVGANVLGSLLCCRAAVQLMRQQHVREQQQQQRGARYHIFNCGFSRWGASLSKSACSHKATKMALTQLNISLAEELREAGLGYIGVHNLSPGEAAKLCQGVSADDFVNVAGASDTCKPLEQRVPILCSTDDTAAIAGLMTTCSV
jgi:NAD(P)-dependent dehydrogenase (short-subunit alcohol dehydrogenase family)